MFNAIITSILLFSALYLKNLQNRFLCKEQINFMGFHRIYKPRG